MHFFTIHLTQDKYFEQNVIDSDLFITKTQMNHISSTQK